MDNVSEDLLKIILSLLLGAVIGIEREYRSKAAGFRTITLISIGATLFTIVSMRLGGHENGDRIASCIITGIGFIGAGAVFKDSLTISGLTTASAIWVTAALGMVIGIGEYKLAGQGLIAVLIVLSLFEYIQDWIDGFHQKRVYKIVFDRYTITQDDIEKVFVEIGLSFIKRKEMKNNSEMTYFYEVYGSKANLEAFNSFLLNQTSIKSFEC